MPAISPGQVLAHYRIVRMLGQGGMGSVYEALATVQIGHAGIVQIYDVGQRAPGR